MTDFPTDFSADSPDDRIRYAKWMRDALRLAERAAAEGEVPVGAILLKDGRKLAEGWNRTDTLSDPTAHAEIVALKRAAALTRNHRLAGTVLVTTLEPCVMCFGAILESRVSKLVFGAADPLRGAMELWKSGKLERYPVPPLSIVGEIEADDCRQLLKMYFRGKRT